MCMSLTAEKERRLMSDRYKIRAGNERDEAIIRGIIHSVQRQEGKPECFDRQGAYCEEKDCVWRPYCQRARG